MRSTIYQTIKNSLIDPEIKRQALEEITRLEESLEDFDMNTDNLNLAFVWDDSSLDTDFWASIAQELDYADLEYRNDESIDFSEYEA